jgi:hypothetical protein
MVGEKNYKCRVCDQRMLRKIFIHKRCKVRWHFRLENLFLIFVEKMKQKVHNGKTIEHRDWVQTSDHK